MGPRNEYHQTKQEALTHLGQKQTQANSKASGHYKNFLALKKSSRLSYALPLSARRQLHLGNI